MKDYEKKYEDFWKRHVEDENGNIDPDKVKRELFDYSTTMHNYSTLLDETCGLSKPNTDARKALDRHDDMFISKGIASDDLCMMNEEGALTNDEIREYFDQEE